MKRILVVDDEEILRMLICDTLEQLNFQIDEAMNGSEALQKLVNEQYDLVILDNMMPKLTGIEVIEQLPPTVKERLIIILLTAKSSQDDREYALQKGVNYFIAKPFSPTALIEKVEKIFADR